MPVEQRVMSAPKGAKLSAVSGAPEAEGAAPPPKKKRTLLLLVIVAVVAGVGLGGAYMVMGSKSEGEAAEVVEPEPIPGEVFKIDPISINLAGGHYLRLGLGLQLVEGAAHEPNAAPALDAAIAMFSGLPIETVSDPAERERLKAELAEQLHGVYHEEVIDVYLTDFVTQ